MVTTVAPARRRRLGWLLTAALLTVLAFTLGGGLSPTGSDAVQAWPFDGLCEEDPEGGPGLSRIQPFPGAMGMLGGTNSPANPGAVVDAVTQSDDRMSVLRLYRDQLGLAGAITPYEWYGTAGLQWTAANYGGMDNGCMTGLWRSASGTMSNTMWSTTMLLGALGLNFYQMATSVDLFTPFLGFVDRILTGDPDIPGDSGLFGALYLNYLTPVLILSAIGLAWTGLVKRRGSEVIQRTAWMIGSVTAAIVFLSAPAAIATQVNGLVLQLQAGLGSSVSWATANAMTDPGDDPFAASELVEGAATTCALPEGSYDQLRRQLLCQQWVTFLYTPWVVGQFGSLAADTTATIGGAPPVEIPGQTPKTSLALTHLDATALNHDALADKLSGNDTFTDRSNDQWTGVVATVKTTGNPALWAGADVGHRFSTALLALVAMILGAGPILWFSLLLLGYQVGTIVLLMLSPLFFLIGANPGAGRKVGLSWVEMILGLQIKRIATVAFLSLTLAMLTITQASTESWILQVLIMAVVAVAMVFFRGKLVGKLSKLKLGSDNSMDNAGSAVKQNVSKAGYATRGATSGYMTAGAPGAAVGAVAGLTAGTAAVTAGMMAGRQIKRAIDEKKRPVESPGGVPSAEPGGDSPGPSPTPGPTPAPGPANTPAEQLAQLRDQHEQLVAEVARTRAGLEQVQQQAGERIEVAQMARTTLEDDLIVANQSVEEGRARLHTLLSDQRAEASDIAEAQSTLQESLSRQGQVQADLLAARRSEQQVISKADGRVSEATQRAAEAEQRAASVLDIIETLESQQSPDARRP